MKTDISGIQTRTAITDSAVSLFATQGVGETSLRAVARGAKINDALVHYHFGSKERLVAAAYKKVMKPIMKQRRSLLRQLIVTCPEDPLKVVELIRVMYWPIFSRFAGKKGRRSSARNGLSLILQVRVSPSVRLRKLIDQDSDSFRELFDDHLQHSLSGVSRKLLWQRMSFVNSIAWDAVSQPFAIELTEDELIMFFEDFLSFSESGLRSKSEHQFENRTNT